MTADEIEDYLEQDKDKVGGLYGRSLDIVKDILKKKKEDLMYQDTDSNLNEPIEEQKLRSVIAKLIKEEDEEEDDVFDTRKEAEMRAMQRSQFNKNEIYYVEEINGKYKVVESMYDEPPRGVYFQNGNRKGGLYRPSPGNDPGNVDESKLRSVIAKLIKEELK